MKKQAEKEQKEILKSLDNLKDESLAYSISYYGYSGVWTVEVYKVGSTPDENLFEAGPSFYDELIDRVNEFVDNQNKINEPTVMCGDILTSEGGDYILAQPVADRLCLISLDDGNRWTYPRFVHNGYIKEHTIEQLIEAGVFSKSDAFKLKEKGTRINN